MSDLLSNLVNAPQAHRQANESLGRSMAVVIATVTKNEDPDNQRRIRCVEPSSPQIETWWIRPIKTHPQIDPPLPRIGDTVLLFRVEDDPTNGWYLSGINDTNPPIDQEDPINDYSEIIPGIRSRLVEGKENVQINQEQTIGVDGNQTITVQLDQTLRAELSQLINARLNVTMRNDAGASLILHEAGVVILRDAYGNQIVLGGASGGLGFASDVIFNLAPGANAIWDMNGGSVNWINCNDFTLSQTGSGGETVATIGAIDDDNDTLTTSGWT